MNKAKLEAIKTAYEWLSVPHCFLDTETTGLDRLAEICEIAIIDEQGKTLLNSLVKTIHGIPAGATAIHGITNEMVENAPRFTDLTDQIGQATNGRYVIIYNSEYDLQMIDQSLDSASGGWEFVIKGPGVGCAMNLYAQFYGEIHPYYGNYSWQKLTYALSQCGLDRDLPEDLTAHRARADAEYCRLVVNYMAKYELMRDE